MLSSIRAGISRSAEKKLSLQQRQRLRRLSHPAWLGTLRRTTPLSYAWGYDRGTPIDRYYIDQFIGENRTDIQGRVLEVKDAAYSRRFGTRVQHLDILDINPDNPDVTIVADLSAALAIPSDHFDCFILTQTLQFIYDTPAAIGHAYRILRPGGVLLVTVPTLGRLDRRLIDYWRFTSASCSALFGQAFGTEQVTVQAYGNVLTAMAYLTGMACEELSLRELQAVDAFFPVTIAVRAVKQVAPAPEV